MELTKWRSRILIGYAVAVVWICFFAVPWAIIREGTVRRVLPSSPIWSPPHHLATVHLSRLAVEMLGVTIVAGVAFLLARPKQPSEKPPEKLSSEDTEISFLTKQCPRCAETITVEDVKCPRCDHAFDLEEVAVKIRQVLAERAKEIARVVDFASARKNCPECGKLIKVEAYVCHYCRHEFTDPMVQIAKINAIRPPEYEILGGVQYGTRCPRCKNEYYSKTEEGMYRCDACGARFH